ncbi:hypothetical protein [Sorangium sp. So ce131]|uniref:hypothetical protein n=1 Tax=Sorangium sp. So ce131 TaxID=3133282 RepID=UPI003F643670
MRKITLIVTVLVCALAPAQAAEPAAGAAAGTADALRAGQGEAERAAGAADAPRAGQGQAEGAAAAASPPGLSGSALEAAPPAAERTARPSAAEWADAEPVLLARSTTPAACKARRRREWLRLDCAAPALAVVKTLGSSAGGEPVRVDAPRGGDTDGGFPGGVSLVFPVRRGDRRVIEILSAEVGYRGASGLVPSVVISEQWIDGDPGPLVSAL